MADAHPEGKKPHDAAAKHIPVSYNKKLYYARAAALALAAGWSRLPTKEGIQKRRNQLALLLGHMVDWTWAKKAALQTDKTTQEFGWNVKAGYPHLHALIVYHILSSSCTRQHIKP